MTYELSFGGTETTVTQSHIHFENATNNGPVVVFLCTNLEQQPRGRASLPGVRHDYRHDHAGNVIGVAGGAAVA